MRHSAAPLLAIALFSAGTAGCSLMGLDRFDWPACGECSRLNARDEIDEATACELWQCDAQLEACVLAPRDEDQDGHVSLRCGGDDCDDTVASTFGGADETCNAVDDDCDGWIDDSPVGDPEEPVAILSAAAPAWIEFDDVAEGVAIAYETEGGAGFEIVSGPTPIDVPGDALELASTVPPYALETSMIAPGCARAVATPHPQALCAASDPRCAGGQECFTSRGGVELCDAPLLGSPPPGQCNADAECDDGDFCNGAERCLPGNPASDSFGCRPATELGCAAGELCDGASRSCVVVASPLSSCTLDDLSVASIGGEWLAAAISPVPCGDGALRLGHFTDVPATPESRFPHRTIAQRGDAPGVRGASWLGIGLGNGESCVGSENGRDAGDPEGSAAPAIAALAADHGASRHRPQAMIAYLAAPSCRATGGCGAPAPTGATGPVDVEVVGAWLEEGSAGGTAIGWMTSSVLVASGLTAAASATRPVIASWTSGGDAGYVVAVARDGGGIGVITSLALPDPAPECGSPPCIVIGSEYPTMLGTTRRPPSPLAPPDVATVFASAAPTGDVAIAMVPSAGTTVELVLAWAEATEVVVARATIAPATGALTEGEVQRFASADASDVAVAHVAGGLARVGAEIDGTEVTEAGGVVASWRTADGTRAVRIADHDGSAIAPGVISLGRTSRHPRAFTGDDGRARVVAHQAGSFVVFPSICGGS